MHWRKAWLRPFYYANLLLLLWLVVYQGYLHLTDPLQTSVHAAQVRAIQQRLEGG